MPLVSGLQEQARYMSILTRRDFIKGLIRCVPVIAAPKLVFDLAPKPPSKLLIILDEVHFIPNPEYAALHRLIVEWGKYINGKYPELVGHSWVE